MLKKIVLNSILVILALFVLAFLGRVLLEHAHGISSISHAIHKNYMFWMIWRYSLMLVFISSYPAIIRYVLKNREDIPNKVVKQHSHRGYAILMCVFYELVLVHNLLSVVINTVLR